MSLHNIPLCGFSYVGAKPSSSATFRYNTVEDLLKAKEKMFYKETIISIEKVNANKHLYKGFSNIQKEVEKRVELQVKEINKNKANHLEETEITEINKNKSKEIQETKDINIYVESNKNLLNTELLQLNKNSEIVNLSNELLQFNKSKSIYTDLVVKEEIFKSAFVQELKLQKDIGIEKHVSNYLERDYLKEIDISKINFIERYDVKYIDKNNYRFIDRYNLKEIDVMANPIILNRDVIRHIFVAKSICNLNPLGIKEMDRNCKTILMYSTALKNIEKYLIKDALDRISVKEMFEINSNKYFYRSGLSFIFKDNEKYLCRKAITTMFKSNEKYFNKEAITNIFKNNERYLGSDPSTNIYKQIEKGLFNISTIDVFKNYYKPLNAIAKEIFMPGNNKFIEVTKRWWWLSPTLPADRLIVPNKDYAKMKDLLVNTDFEYLRYNNHPIEWGQNWGIDYNIPPIGVSIEIMLDLINILTMVWHKNTQGWLSVTGKEAIQLFMELFYDWYTLDTSRPNQDYYRAYRWIRWEAEKVYFLDTENGLQAIGILIANLIDYMKYHHFNLVPIWRNPKTMDIERSFNRIATNGDLMKLLDKNKGNRHYHIETQNFERKNILGR